MERTWSTEDLAATIDHSLLRATATAQAVRNHCAEAKTYGFAAVCVNPCWVSLCASELEGSGIPVCSVVGYPLGASSSGVKAAEAAQAIRDGASEIDMVLNVGKAKSGDWTGVEEDIRAVVAAAAPRIVKVILETCYLTADEKVRACRAVAAAGAAFVQTSTGFGTGGATIEDITLIRAAADGSVRVKASGGIRTKADAIALLRAGAERIGASAGVAIVAETQPEQVRASKND